MLLLVLLCVLASFTMLVLALFTGSTEWAWGSVAASAAGGALLIADWMSRRRPVPGPPSEGGGTEPQPPSSQ